jgi:hypothetical protein
VIPVLYNRGKQRQTESKTERERERETDRLTVGAASSSITAQVVALFPSLSDMTPARIPPIQTDRLCDEHNNQENRSGLRVVLFQ